MKTLISGVLILMTSIAPAFAQSLKKQERKIAEVNAIEVSAGINVYLTKGKSDRVRIESNIDDFNKISIKQSGKTLTVGYNTLSNVKLKNKDIETNIYLSVDELSSVTASSASKVVSSNQFKSDSFKAKASSSATININIEAKSIDADASSSADINLNFKAQDVLLSASSSADINAKGSCTTLNGSASSSADLNINTNAQNVSLSASSSADIKAEGKCTEVSIKGSSAAEVKAAKLIAEKATVLASSSADVTVYASKSLNAKASSGSDVYYAGNPASKTNNASSGGSIKMMK